MFYRSGPGDVKRRAAVSVQRLLNRLHNGPARQQPRQGRTLDRRKHLEQHLDAAMAVWSEAEDAVAVKATNRAKRKS
jgi:hypothetical protein